MTTNAPTRHERREQRVLDCLSKSTSPWGMEFRDFPLRCQLTLPTTLARLASKRCISVTTINHTKRLRRRYYLTHWGVVELMKYRMQARVGV
jgi:hypothetical protein